MFPIPFNFPFRKKDGSVTSIGSAIESGGGSYTLPTASASTKGGVKIGAGLSMDGEVLNNSNPTAYTLPTASASTKGGVKIGDGLTMDGEVLKVSGGGGGGNKYCHALFVNSTYSNGRTIILTDSATEFTVETLAAWLYNNNFRGNLNDKSNRYPLMLGAANSGITIASSNGTDVTIYTSDGSGHTDTQYYTVYDIVTTF